MCTPVFTPVLTPARNVDPFSQQCAHHARQSSHRAHSSVGPFSRQCAHHARQSSHRAHSAHTCVPCESSLTPMCTPVFTPVFTPVRSVNPFSLQCAHQCSHQCVHQCGVSTPAHINVAHRCELIMYVDSCPSTGSFALTCRVVRHT